MRIDPTTLRSIATDMKAELATRDGDGRVQRILQPYALILCGRNGSLRLYVGDLNYWLLPEETLPIAEAFGVPLEDQEPAATITQMKTRTGTLTSIKTMRYAWAEDLTVPCGAPTRPS